MVTSVGETVLAMRIILLGPPGAGKGTQAKILAKSLGAAHIASGDLFRYNQQKGTPLGLKAIEYMNQGLLVPDEITIAMVMEQILPPIGPKKFLLDGFPRNMVQAEALHEALAARGQGIDRVIVARVPHDELVRRLGGRLVCQRCQTPYHSETAPPRTSGVCDLCGGELYQREDDKPEAVRVRIRVYEEETEPLIQYYRQSGGLVEVDGVGTMEEVGQRILGTFQNWNQIHKTGY